MNHTTPPTPANYVSYLIRVWRDGEQAPWRASITHVLTGETHKFSSLALALAHLQTQWGEQAANTAEPASP